MRKFTDFRELSAIDSIPAKAIEFMIGLSDETPNGRYEFDETCYAVVTSYDSKLLSAEMQMEAHEDYIDVQAIVAGTERILCADKEDLIASIPYDPQKDVAFYEYDVAEEVRLGAGEAVILETAEAHLPGIAIDAPIYVKKAVLKLRKVR